MKLPFNCLFRMASGLHVESARSYTVVIQQLLKLLA
jgi:hypothetical protein